TKEKISLLNFLPSNTVFWAKDFDFVLGKLGKFEEELPEKLGKITVSVDYEDQWLKELSAEDFENTETWLQQLRQRNLIQWNPAGSGSEESVIAKKDVQNRFSFLKEEDANYEGFAFRTAAQPVFNRQFNLLIEDLKKRCGQKCTPFIFAENPKQLERLRSIFEDQEAGINFIPIPVSISQGFLDEEKNILCYTDHQIFQRYHKYKVKQAYSKGKALTIRALKELQPGDYVTHIDHGVGVYSGLQKIEVNGNLQEAIRIIYCDNDVLYVNINSLHKISKYTGKEGTQPKVNKLGSDAWEKLKNKTKKQVKDIAADLIKLYAKRKASSGFAFSPDSYMQTELEASFFYEDTPDQSKATADVKRDMESPAPMDRLVCGDVGFGKTEVAVRAAFKAVADSKQA